MPKVSVYLSDELYRQVREHDLPLSALAQAAVERALTELSVAGWIDHERTRPPRMTAAIDTAAVMDDVRGEFGT